MRLPYSEIADLKKEKGMLTKENKKLKSKNVAINNKYTKLKNNIKASKGISTKIAKRLIRNVSMNTGSVLVESVPYWGIGTVIGVTAMDVNDACNTMKDVNSILTKLGETADTNSVSTICSYADRIPNPQAVATYLDQSTDQLKKASHTKMNEVSKHVGDFNYHLGGFIDHVVTRTKKRWENTKGFLKYLIFEYKR